MVGSLIDLDIIHILYSHIEANRTKSESHLNDHLPWYVRVSRLTRHISRLLCKIRFPTAILSVLTRRHQGKYKVKVI